MEKYIDIERPKFKQLVSLKDKINSYLNEIKFFESLDDPIANLKIFETIMVFEGTWSERERTLIKTKGYEPLGADYGKEITNEEDYKLAINSLSSLERPWIGYIAIREERSTRGNLYLEVVDGRLKYANYLSDNDMHSFARRLDSDDLNKIIKEEIGLEIK